MRKVITITHVTLDGIMQSPGGPEEDPRALIAAELVDEFRLWVFPLVLGRGKRLFEEGVPPHGLTLVESRGTPNGVLMNTYRPAGPLPGGSLGPEDPSEAEVARRRKLVPEEARG